MDQLDIRDKKAKLRVLPISRLFPNVITIMAICFGFTSISYGIKQEWDVAAVFIIIAGFLDVVDGRLARYLKASSNFGAQLDSLADFINFGIAPALITYLWCLHEVKIKGLGWALALSYVICTAIRLARFNSDLVELDKPDWKEGFFTGIPSPAGAYLVVMPMMLSFEFDIIDYINPIAMGVYILAIGIMMASIVPTFATKKLIIKKEYISLILVSIGGLIGLIIVKPWIILPALGIAYLCSIPFSIRSFRRLSKKI